MKPFYVLLAYLGLLIGISIHALSLAWGLPLVAVLAFLSWWGRRDATYPLVLLCGVVVGLLRWWPLPSVPPTLENVSCQVEVAQSSYYEIICDSSRLMVYASSLESEWMEGNTVLVTGTIEPLRRSGIPYLFDFGMYQTRLGIQGVLRITSVTLTDATPTWSYSMRRALLARIPPSARDWIQWILFGERIEGEFQTAIVQFSLVDLMVVSGLHIQFLASLILYGLAQGKPKLSDYAIVAMLLLPLAHLMGWPLSMMRSIAMFGLGALLQSVRWRVAALDRVACVGIVFLLVNPRWLFSSAYQFSFLATFWIAYLHPFVHRLPTWSRLLALNGLVTLGLLPLLISTRFEISLWSPLLHIVLSPVILGLFVVSLLSLMGLPLSSVITDGFTLLNNALQVLQNNPLMVSTGAPSVEWTIAWWLVFLVGVSMIRPTQRRYRRLSGGLLFALLSGQLVSPKIHPYYEIIFLDVAQGDATLIITPYQHDVILIDTGGHYQVDYATTRLIPYFKARGIHQLDAVFVTHDDMDHQGALPSLLSHFLVAKVYTNSSRLSYAFHDIEIHNYNPLLEEMTGDDNDLSMVLGWSIDTMDYLVMGDASIAVETKIIATYPNLQADVLRIGHHGSNTSTSGAFLNHVSPQLAIISVGLYNRYGHPHSEVVQRLAQYRVPTYRTSTSGTLQIVQKNGNVTLRGTLDLV